jgi:hypothetical protein
MELETLKQVKFIFELQSDHSTNCNGYRLLCEMIKVEEKHKKKKQKIRLTK